MTVPGASSTKVCVLGAGLWGTVLAQRVAEKGRPVGLWEFFPDLARNLQVTRRHPGLPELRLHPRIAVSADIAACAAHSRLLLFVLPSQHVRHTAKTLRPMLEGAKTLPIVVSASKGIEPTSLMTMAETIEDEIRVLKGRVLVFSGPSFAREVAKGVATKILLAGKSGPHVREAIAALNTQPIVVEHHPDRKGVELGGGLKNVLAIGCGILDGLGSGANTKAVLVTQGVAEMGRLIQKLGGRFDTIYSLAGLGDLFATGTSPESRNRALGEKLGQGKDLRQAIKEIPTVVEGVESARSAFRMCQAAKLKAPIIESIWGVLHEAQPPRKVLEAIGFF